MSEIVIRTENMQRHFGAVKAVNGISFQVPAGIIFGFLGPNGSGKTTTIRLLLGLLEPSGGKAEVLGFDTANQGTQIRERSGALLEHTGLYERMNAEDNLDFYGEIWHLPRMERKARIHELLTEMGLWDRRNETVTNWSRGMKQKLAIARALLHRPELVFLDEPTAGLDPVAAAALRDDLENLTRKQGVTVFLTTHNLTEAEKMCAQVAVIRQGQLMMSGSPDELRMQSGGQRMEVVGRNFSNEVLNALSKRPEVNSVAQEDHHINISLKDNADTTPLITMLVQQGVLIEEVRKGKASLEEVFLSLMEEEPLAVNRLKEN